MKNSMRLVWILFLASGLALLTITGSDNLSSASCATGGIKRIVNKQGWKIPGLGETSIFKARDVWKVRSDDGNEEFRVYSTLYKSKREVISELPTYALADDGVLYVGSRSVAVDEIVQFDVGGRVFGYNVNCTLKSFDARTHTGGSTGQITVYYYDDDGNGVMSTLETGRPPYSPRLPEWVKEQLHKGRL
jgi:hypothetical protein